MSTNQLRTAVVTAGTEATACTAALLFVAGETAHEQEDAASVVLMAAYGTLMRDTPGTIDPLLVGACVAADGYDPGTVAAVVADIEATAANAEVSTVAVLAAAVAREVQLAAYAAADALADTDDLDRLLGE